MTCSLTPSLTHSLTVEAAMSLEQADNGASAVTEEAPSQKGIEMVAHNYYKVDWVIIDLDIDRTLNRYHTITCTWW